MFQGDKSVAYLEDLEALYRQVVIWLTGEDGNPPAAGGYAPIGDQGVIDPSMILLRVSDQRHTADSHTSWIEFRGRKVSV